MPDGDRGVLVERVDVGLVLGGLVFLVGALEADKSLEGLDGRRGDGVHFPVPAPTVETRIGKPLGGDEGETLGVTANGFLGEFLQADAAHLGRGVGKMIANQIVAEANGLKELASVIAGEHADAHLRHDFEQAFVHGLAVGRDDFSGIEVREGSIGLPAGGKFPDKIRADGGGAEPDETGKVMYVPAIGGLCKEGGPHAETCTDQTVMDRGDGEEHGDRGLRGIGPTV